jgi:hypothetical protein
MVRSRSSHRHRCRIRPDRRLQSHMDFIPAYFRGASVKDPAVLFWAFIDTCAIAHLLGEVKTIFFS